MNMIADYQCHVGEGPLWHPTENKLYWTDIPTGRMFRYDPHTHTHEQFFSGDVVGGFTIQADGSLLLFMARGAVAHWRNGTITYILRSLPNEEDSRFNDVIADPLGGVFCGTMSTPERAGSLYHLDTNGRISVVLQGLGCPNGMGFTPDRTGFYFTDSTVRRIYRFAYDKDTGTITDQQVFVETPPDQGVPDGMTVDQAGNVWSARWDGSAIYVYAPDGTETQTLSVPARKASSVVFGGETYQDLYITTAGGQNKAQEGPGAGALFCVHTEVPGVAEFVSQVGV